MIPLMPQSPHVQQISITKCNNDVTMRHLTLDSLNNVTLFTILFIFNTIVILSSSKDRMNTKFFQLL